MQIGKVLKQNSSSSCSGYWRRDLLSRHLVAHVNLGEAEGAEVRVGFLHSRLDGFSEQLVQKLADERPQLLHCLGEEREKSRLHQAETCLRRWHCYSTHHLINVRPAPLSTCPQALRCTL